MIERKEGASRATGCQVTKTDGFQPERAGSANGHARFELTPQGLPPPGEGGRSCP